MDEQTTTSTPPSPGVDLAHKIKNIEGCIDYSDSYKELKECMATKHTLQTQKPMKPKKHLFKEKKHE